MRCADGCYAENRNADGGDDKTNHGGQDVSSGQLSEVNGENQVACAKEHAKQGSGHQNLLPDSQFFCCHQNQLLYGNDYNRNSCKMEILDYNRYMTFCHRIRHTRGRIVHGQQEA